MKKNYLIAAITFAGLIFLSNHCFGQNQTKADSLNSLSDTTIYTVVHNMPSLGGSNDSLQKYIVQHSKYPALPKRSPTTKNVFVQIIIDKDGRARFDKIARGYNEKYDAEAKRIAENMPNWTPGTLADGTRKRVVLMFPIWFE